MSLNKLSIYQVYFERRILNVLKDFYFISVSFAWVEH